MEKQDDYEIKLNAFEAGFLAGLVAERREEVPRLWEQLMVLQKKFGEESCVSIKELGNNMVEITDKAGIIITREKYPWE